MNKSFLITAVAVAITAGTAMVAGAQGDNSSGRAAVSSPLPAMPKTSPSPKFSPNALQSITPPNNSTGDSSK
jgi:hypothetical protein